MPLCTSSAAFVSTRYKRHFFNWTSLPVRSTVLTHMFFTSFLISGTVYTLLPPAHLTVNFIVSGSPRRRFANLLALIRQRLRRSEHTLQHGRNITFHNLNKYKAICHCHVKVAPSSVCPRRPASLPLHRPSPSPRPTCSAWHSSRKQ